MKSNNEDISIQELNMDTLQKGMIDQIVEVHEQSFKGFFLTSLGKVFLKQLYMAFIKHPKSGMIIAREENEILGFLAFSYNLSDLYKSLIRNKFIVLAWLSAFAIIKRPFIIGRLVRTMMRSTRNKDPGSYLDIASICVLPSIQNRGIGRGMIDRLKQSNSIEYDYIRLETDAKDNDSVNQFYVQNGFQLLSTYTTREGRSMNVYRFEFLKEQI